MTKQGERWYWWIATIVIIDSLWGVIHNASNFPNVNWLRLFNNLILIWLISLAWCGSLGNRYLFSFCLSFKGISVILPTLHLAYKLLEDKPLHEFWIFWDLLGPQLLGLLLFGIFYLLLAASIWFPRVRIYLNQQHELHQEGLIDSGNQIWIAQFWSWWLSGFGLKISTSDNSTER